MHTRSRAHTQAHNTSAQHARHMHNKRATRAQYACTNARTRALNLTSVELLLEKIAMATGSAQINALIDTGALITGYSNQEVAAQLLQRGLKWCDGVVFLDDTDSQQVIMPQRATNQPVCHAVHHPARHHNQLLGTLWQHMMQIGSCTRDGPCCQC